MDKENNEKISEIELILLVIQYFFMILLHEGGTPVVQGGEISWIVKRRIEIHFRDWVKDEDTYCYVNYIQYC